MMGKKLCAVHKIAWVLLIIGGLNWGLVAGVFNVVDIIFGHGSLLAKIVYLLVGISAIMVLGAAKCCAKGCNCSDGSCNHCGTESKPGTSSGVSGQNKM